MDYEEKYKEALEIAKKVHGSTMLDDEKMLMEQMFPELRSDSEMIRDDIIIALNDLALIRYEKVPEEWIAWLEKQGKTLDADDILPYLGNNQVQDILEDMGMIDDNGQCTHTAEEIFKAGMEHAFNLNREATSSIKVK